MNKKEMKQKSKKGWIKWVLVGIFVLALGVGAKIVKDQKTMADRKYVMEKQRELMIESWKEEGLTEEEIKERMETMGERRADRDDEEGEVKGIRPPEGAVDVMRMGRMMK